MIKNDNIDYDQVALRFASPVPPRVKNSVTIAALKQKFSLLPAAARSLDVNFDGFLSEGGMTKALTKAGVIIQLADIRFVRMCKFLPLKVSSYDTAIRALLDIAEKSEDGRVNVESFVQAALVSFVTQALVTPYNVHLAVQLAAFARFNKVTHFSGF